MTTIWKHPLLFSPVNELMLPIGYRLLKIGLDPSGVLSVWALLDEHQPMTAVRFYMYGTGHSVSPAGKKYFDTVLDGSFVWHVFVDEATVLSQVPNVTIEGKK